VVFAQTSSTTNYARFETVPEKTLQLGYYASANADCTPARRPTIRVIESPGLGTLSVELGDLTTDRFASCPKLTTPARVVSYVARKGDDEIDQIIYEVTYANGDLGVYQVTIEIGKCKNPPRVLIVKRPDEIRS
jgi:hypothetical protein